MDAHERHQFPPVLFQPDSNRPRERSARLLFGIRAACVGRWREKFPRGFIRENPSRLPRTGDSTGNGATAETAETRRQEQAAEATGLSAHPAWNGWRRL